MNRRLFVEYLRRHRSHLLWSVPATFAFWFAGGLDPMGRVVIVGSIAVTLLVGPLLTQQMFSSRAIFHMPVSRAEIWRTRWWLSTVVPVSFITTGKIAALLLVSQISRRPTVPFETAWLSSAYDLVVAGWFLALVPWIRFPSNPHITRLQRFLQRTGAVLALAAMLGTSLVLMFLSYASLPTRWHELSWMSGGLLLAAFGLSLAGFLHTPAITATAAPGDRRLPESRTGLLAGLFANVTGVKRMVIKTAATAAFYQVIFMVLIVGATAVISPMLGPRHQGLAHDLGLLPAATGAPRQELFLLYICGSFGLMWYPMLGGDAIVSTLRHLRTLPLTTSQTTAIIMGLPLIGFVTLWLVLAILHVVVTGQPPASLRLTEFVALAGIHSIVRALDLKWGTQPYRILLVALPVLFVCSQILRAGAAGPPILIAAGLAAIGFAATINRNTLTRQRPLGAPTEFRLLFGKSFVPGPK